MGWVRGRGSSWGQGSAQSTLILRLGSRIQRVHLSSYGMACHRVKEGLQMRMNVCTYILGMPPSQASLSKKKRKTEDIDSCQVALASASDRAQHRMSWCGQFQRWHGQAEQQNQLWYFHVCVYGFGFGTRMQEQQAHQEFGTEKKKDTHTLTLYGNFFLFCFSTQNSDL